MRRRGIIISSRASNIALIGTEDLLVFERSVDPKGMDQDLILFTNPMAADYYAFGEILWDCLPSGKHAGGAPFNVTAHLAQSA